MFDPVTVPLYVLVLPYVLFSTYTTAIFWGFMRGTILSRRQADAELKPTNDAKEELRSTVQSQQAALQDFQRRSVVLPAGQVPEVAAAAANTFLTGGS